MLQTQPMSKLLRLGVALLLLISVFSAGYSLRSPLIVFLLALVFSAGYIAGKWRVWQHWRTQSVVAITTQLLSVYVIQTILVCVLYLLGAGLANVVGFNGFSKLAAADFVFSLIVMILIIVSCVVINRLEAGRPPGTRTFATAKDMHFSPSKSQRSQKR
jgi:hypothetical protein